MHLVSLQSDWMFGGLGLTGVDVGVQRTHQKQNRENWSAVLLNFGLPCFGA